METYGIMNTRGLVPSNGVAGKAPREDTGDFYGFKRYDRHHLILNFSLQESVVMLRAAPIKCFLFLQLKAVSLTEWSPIWHEIRP